MRGQNKTHKYTFPPYYAGSQCRSHGSDGPAESFPGDAEEIHPRETEGIAPRHDGVEGGDVIGMNVKGIASLLGSLRCHSKGVCRSLNRSVCYFH